MGSPPTGGTASPVPERLVQAPTRRAPGRHQADEDAGEDGDAETEEKRASVDFDAHPERQLDRDQSKQESQQRPRQQRPERPAGEAQRHALRQQHAHEPRPAGPKGRAHGQLPRPLPTQGEQQVRHVHTDDQQQRGHGPEEQAQVRPQGPDLGFPKGYEAQAHGFVRLGKLRGEAGGKRSHVRSGGLGGKARSQPGQCRVDAVVAHVPEFGLVGPAVVGVSRLQRHPEIRAVREAEPGRHHSHHFVTGAAQPDGAAEDPGVRAEHGPPESVAQDRLVHVSAHLVLGRREVTAHRRGNSERAEEL